ncbi:VWA domain-containing protein [Agrobacterium rubi]|nr:VWA domain-containing protein [Agrobacterium rubi]NTF24905.1 VWA domain-containing protein [Agrobacterium rubi]
MSISTTLKSLPHTIESFMKDRLGNFGMITALLLPVLAGGAGVALDVSSAMAAKNQMAGAADSGALAAASSLVEKRVTETQAKEIARQFISTQVSALGISASDYTIDVGIRTTTLSATRKKYDVDVVVSASLPTTLTQILGHKSIPVSVAATASAATANQTSMSMYLVLDRSGSMKASVTSSIRSSTTACDYNYLNSAQTAMYTVRNQRPCYYERMEVLQTAVDNLMDALAKSDRDKRYIRTGAVGYSSEMFKPTDIDWGTDKTRKYVDDMFAEGGTSSTDAFEEAVTSLTKLSENSAHMTKNGLVPVKYIVFMTDGENSSSSDNTRTQSLCTKAKTAGITVYTVGFMLSTNASKNLMTNCASSSKTYFDAQDGDRLAAAFADIARQTSGTSPILTN